MLENKTTQDLNNNIITPKKKRKPKTKPLKNPKHEKFCQEVIKEQGVISKAYRNTSPTVKKNSSYVGANKLIHRPEVQQRISVILNSLGMDKTYWSKKLKTLSNAKKPLVIDGSISMINDNSIQLESTKVGLKLHNVLNEGDQVTIDARSISLTDKDPITQRLGHLINSFDKIITKLNNE